MSHFFDLIGMHQQIFRLSHLALGAKQYARFRQLQKGDIDYQSDWSIYYGHIRNAVSNDLIELAAKVRVAQDTMLEALSESELRELDADSVGRSSIGNVEVGAFALTLRESCNKILHAKHFELGISRGRATRPSFRYNYWSGSCTLRGNQSRNEWVVALHVNEWCGAMDAFTESMAQHVKW